MKVIKAIVAGGIILGIGLALLIVAFALNGWKFTSEFEMKEFSAQGDVSELKIDNAVGSVKTEFYEGDKVIVNYPVSERYFSSVEENAGVLTVNGLKQKRWWYGFISVSSLDFPVTLIRIPQSAVLKLEISVNAGSVELAEGQYSETNVTVNAGKLDILGIVCPNFKCKVNAGSVWIKSLKSASLDCNVNAGSFVADKVAASLINATVSAGSANLAVVGAKESYEIKVTKNVGTCNVTNQSCADPEKKIEIVVHAGSVNVTFI